MIYTDAHCHILSPATAPSEIAVRVSCATRPAEWESAITNKDDRTFAAIGIHPWHIANAAPDWETQMYNLLVANPDIMVGEIGLDKYHDNMPAQVQIFTTQLEMAAKLRRPIQLHCVGAWDKVLEIFKLHKSSMPPAVIAHAFGGDSMQMERLANEYNMYFSFGITQPGDKSALRIASAPVSHILSESDTFDSDDEVQRLSDSVATIAEIHGLPPMDMADTINANLQRILSYVRPIE
ncbi:MAG: TatD family hydrolase [Alphaproteobacteria bacterium]|nr:TatD family hydrolase [Alphaproteobacteria bacterium]